MTQLTTVNASQPSQAAQTSAGSDLFGRFSAIGSRLTDRLKESGVVSSNLSANLDSLIGGLKNFNFSPADRDLTITKIVESIMDPSSSSLSAIAKTENYLYFDPRSASARGQLPPPSTALRQGGVGAASGPGGAGPGSFPGGPGSIAPGQGASFGQRRQGFVEAVVFTVGGGSMDEYGNLQDWVARTSGGGGVGGSGGSAGPGGVGGSGAVAGGGYYAHSGAQNRRRVVYGSTEMLSAREFIKEELERLGKEVGA